MHAIYALLIIIYMVVHALSIALTDTTLIIALANALYA